ncbi:MAG: nucleotidyltransferase domain-containing protein [Bacteroidetes bacterium]|nr:nucleotidyltransferase domain-containing protein [Bacteroidota bacterium]
MLAPIITNNLSRIKDICQKHRVKELYVFGSVTTEKFNAESDIDFLYIMNDVPLEKAADNFFGLLWEFEGLLQRKIDMVPYANMRNRIFIEEVNNTKQLLYKS